MTEETTAFANARIFDGVSAELREGCVRVAAGTIVEVGEGPEAGDRVIDCRGRTVVPGLIDAHFHAYGARLSLMEIETSPLSYLALAGARRLAGALGRGFTTVRDPGGGDAGPAQAIREGLTAAPRYLFCGATRTAGPCSRPASGWRARRAATCSSRSSRLPSGRALRIARAYSSVWSRPGTTSGSYQRRTVAWASMSAHSWNQPYRRCFWPFFRWSHRRVRAPRGVQHGYRVQAGREVLGRRPLPRLDLADHVVRDVGPGGQVLLGQAYPGPVEAQLRAEHARGRPGSVGIVRHLIGILSGRAAPGRRSVGIRADPVSNGSPRATGCET